MKVLVGGSLSVVLALPAGMAVVMVGASGSTSGGRPSAHALADIPQALVGVYQSASASCPGLPWSVLAAIGKVETDHGRHGGAQLHANGDVRPRIVGIALDGSGGTALIPDSDGGRLDGDPTLDRAVGPMQFLPGTWARWGRDGNGDGGADPHNAIDAIVSAADYLCGDDGRVSDLAAAIGTYNRSSAYVREVLEVAAGYREVEAVAGAADVASVLAHPNLTITAGARADLESGLVDARVVAVLGVIADRFQITVGVLRSGHAECVGGGNRATRPGCSVSHHWHYRAVDVPVVGGRPVSTTNPAARHLAEFLATLPPPLRPDELGQPWAALGSLPGVFSDADHQGHLHLGYRATPGGP